ncbi:MAG: SemiSWEET family transporter [Ilumatobacteraceae bacterium]
MESFLGVWCTALSLGYIWPQVWRTVRHDTTHGLSAVAAIHGSTGAGLWLAYGLGTGNTPIWFSNASFLVAQAIIISVMRRHGRVPTVLLARFGGSFAVLFAISLPFPTWAFGWIATAVSASSLVPQALHVARAENMHAISLVSWVATIISAASWMVFGWVLDDPIMSIVNYITIPMMVFILVRATRWRLMNGVPLTGRALVSA